MLDLLGSTLGGVKNLVGAVGSTVTGTLGAVSNALSPTGGSSGTSNGSGSVTTPAPVVVKPQPADISANASKFNVAFYNVFYLVSSVLAVMAKEVNGIIGTVDVAIIKIGTVIYNAAKYITSITPANLNNVSATLTAAIKTIAANANDATTSIANINGGVSDQFKTGLQIISHAMTIITQSFTSLAQEVLNALGSANFDAPTVISGFLAKLTTTFSAL